MKVIIDTNTLQYIKMFQTITRAEVLDCIDNGDKLLFVVTSTKGIWPSVKRTEMLLKKKIKVIEFVNNVKEFTRRLVPDALDIQVNGGEVRIKVRKYDKPKVIGKEKRNLNVIKRLLEDMFEIGEVKVI
ncbi:MAG: hypothetical protein J7L43_03330 [Candidatus Aenigmarchaeota archaeon]|nr:hypothetical protein [Candidatus Aenigmarchaeota archaeon]